MFLHAFFNNDCIWQFKKNVDSFFCFGLTVINMLFIVIFVLFQFKYNLANKSKSSEKYLEKN